MEEWNAGPGEVFRAVRQLPLAGKLRRFVSPAATDFSLCATVEEAVQPITSQCPAAAPGQALRRVDQCQMERMAPPG